MASNSAYTASAREIAELFADYLEGGGNRPATVLSERALGDDARNALERSFESFGFEDPACTYATLLPRDAEAEGGDIRLDPQALFALLEALDPLFVIAADAAATGVLAQAYRTDFPSDAAVRAFGRPSVTFADLQTLLQTPEGKQRAWALLKSLR